MPDTESVRDPRRDASGGADGIGAGALHPDAVAVAQASAEAAGLSVAEWLSRTILDNAGSRALPAAAATPAAAPEPVPPDPLAKLEQQLKIAEQAALAAHMRVDDWLSRAILTALDDQAESRPQETSPPSAPATPPEPDSGATATEATRSEAPAAAPGEEAALGLENALEVVAAALDAPRTEAPVSEPEPPADSEDRLALIVQAARRELELHDTPPLEDIIARPEERAAIVLSDEVEPRRGRRRVATWLMAILLIVLSLVAAGVWLIPRLAEMGMPIAADDRGQTPNVALPPAPEPDANALITESAPAGDRVVPAPPDRAATASPGEASTTPPENAVTTETLPAAPPVAEPRQSATLDSKPPTPPSAHIPWYEGAAANGDVDAQMTLARMYLFGEGVPRDYAKAARWFREAADNGSADGQYAIAVLMERGLGVRKDPAGAIAWYEAAARSGHLEALNNTGIAYFEGKIVAQDYARALSDFRSAAESGLAEAQFNLALLYSEGYGVKPDLVEAFKWYSLALAGGEDRARAELDRLSKRMSPDAIGRARKSIAAFRAK